MSNADKEPTYLAEVIPPDAGGITDRAKRLAVQTIHRRELHPDETQEQYDEGDVVAAKKMLTPDELANVYSMHANDGHKLGIAAPRDPYATNREPRNWTKQKRPRTSQRAGR